MLGMCSARTVSLALGICALASAQSGTRGDFRRDVQPLFKQNCYECHGPTQQMNGFRLDRRRDAMLGGTIAVIGPGNSAGSRLYQKLIGNEFGMRMPPAGPLKDEQIRVIRDWIDQGAEWPDDLAGDVPPPPLNPKAARMMQALRDGDRAGFRKAVKESPASVNGFGPGGATPLLYAALYGDASDVRLLLDAGADPNKASLEGSTPLMWAVPDLEKTKLLLERGAQADARSNDGRTALLIAAGWRNSSAALALLIKAGANPSAASPLGDTPLAEATYIADADAVRTLIQGGAELKQLGFVVFNSIWSDCAKCFELISKAVEPADLEMALIRLANLGNTSAVKFLLDRGANAKSDGGPVGHPPLVAAAGSNTVPMEIVNALIQRGADVNARNRQGQTALQLARMRGDANAVKMLLAAGAKDDGAPGAQAPAPSPAASPRAAIERSLPLLQRVDVDFFRKAGCVSCHNNSLTAMSVAAARKAGIAVNETVARQQLKLYGRYLEAWRERLLQNHGIPGDADTVSYILLGLAAENYAPDAATDAAARYIASRQLADGSWRVIIHRPPIESNDIEVTAASMRALRVFAPKTRKAEYDQAVARAAAWLAKSAPKTTEEHAFRILGLAWANADREAIRSAVRGLVQEQRSDGGWAQIPTLASDAYATGEALFALAESGELGTKDDAFAKGVRFLLSTQLADGSWFVKTRAIPLQPYFDAGFPHGADQWISATGTNWATIALAKAAGTVSANR